MTKTRTLVIVPVLLFFLWACGRWGVGLPENVVARINGEEITLQEFSREFREQTLEPRAGAGNSQGDLKKACLDQMIERKILVEEARKTGIKISPVELGQAILEMTKDYSEKEFTDRLTSRGSTMEEWKGRLEEKLLAEKMMRNASRYRGTVDESEALQYYQGHASSFQLPLKVRVRQIVVADGEEAIQLLKRLKRGENFEKLAAEKSLGPEKVNGGDLGYFSPGERPPEFDRVFEMAVGALSEVIKSPYGYHIFKLEDRIESRQMPFEEAKAGILQDLARQKGEAEYRRWLKDLTEKSKVVINRKVLYS